MVMARRKVIPPRPVYMFRRMRSLCNQAIRWVSLLGDVTESPEEVTRHIKPNMRCTSTNLLLYVTEFGPEPQSRGVRIVICATANHEIHSVAGGQS